MKEDNSEIEERLSAFYHERLVPLALTAEERGAKFFNGGPEGSSESYYVSRTDDGGYIHEIDFDNIERELADMWNLAELPELAEFAGELVMIANEFRRDAEDGPDEVSPFVYAMF
jgi:hypothetical protein